MGTFRYKARDQMGKLVEGAMEAATEHDLVEKLRKMGYVVTGIASAAGTVSLEEIFAGLVGARSEDAIFFNVQLSNMLDAGLPLLGSLRAISSQTENKRFKKIIEDITIKVEAGASFSEALQTHPAYFSKLAVSMIRAGEASGNLSLVLRRLAEFGEKELDLKEKVSSAVLYPFVLTVASIIVIIFIVTSIIPKFAEIFDRLNVPLPLVTRILNSFGITLRDHWHLFLLAVIALFLGARIFINTKSGRLWYDQMTLGAPLIGPLMRKAALSRFARTLATLFSSGVPILESLEILEGTIGNEVLARIITTLREAVRGGSKISEPLRISGEFPSDIVQMIAAGEETGNLDVMLNKVADLYDSAVGYSIKRMTALIEPLFILVMGGVVAMIMASILVPMFDMVKVLRR